MGGKSSNPEPIVTGYNYYVSMQLVFCWGPVDKITHIIADEEKVAWTGSVTNNDTINVSAPNLYGGTDREGGIGGPIDVCFGYPTQTQNSYLATAWEETYIPAFRDVFSTVLKRFLIGSNNYYVKPIGAQLTRIYTMTRGVSQWQPTKAEPLPGLMNPIHIIREAILEPWGMNRSITFIDDANFIAAAQTCYNEGLGFAFEYSNSTPIEDFIKSVEEHANAVLYTDFTTGKMKIKLIRDDYVEGSLPLFNYDNIIKVSSLKQTALNELPNSIVVNFMNNNTWKKDISTPARNITAIAMYGLNHRDVDRMGIRTRALATKVSQQILQQIGSPLWMVEFTCTRAGEVLYEGAVFRFDFPKALELETPLIMRVTEINYGDSSNEEISIVAIQDVFSAAETVYTTPPETGWVDPINEPSAMTYKKVIEIPYYTMARFKGDAFAQNYDINSSAIAAFGVKPTTDCFTAGIYSRAGSDPFIRYGSISFCPIAILSGSLGINTSATINISSQQYFDLVDLNSLLLIDNEIVEVTNINLTSMQLTINRGILDTVPSTHANGAYIYAWGKFVGTDNQEWLTGETIGVKLTPRTPKGELDVSLAPTDTVALVGRLHAPYAPGNVKINGSAYPTTVSNPITVTWSHRNRLLQTGTIFTKQTDGDISVEAGTTYTLKLYDGTTFDKEYTGISGTSQAISFTGTPSNPRITLEAIRDGINSYQKHDISFTIT